ncbi:MAG: hypothetical protein FJ288_15800 [Planctomycetes bacterium]|nr:hypothetical protein [Planctomycetota bacterium]
MQANASDRPGADVSSGAPPARASWVLLPLAWCLWLLAFLAPSMLVAPHLATVRPWLAADSAPAALVAAAALFLTVVWPFWPALAGPASGGRIAARWLGRSLLEALMLAALAGPFVLMAWALAGRTPEALLPCAVGAGLAAVGLAFRLFAAWLGPRPARWVILAAMLVDVGPLALAYAASETLGAGPGSPIWQVLQASPVWQAVRLAG